jgi:hypothetical protein
MKMKFAMLLGAIALGSVPAVTWEIPPDNGIMNRETIAAS